MFTGIIETIARVHKIEKEGSNIHFTFESELSSEFKIDQSVSHNGVCLTVIALEGNTYTVTAIEETLVKSNIGELKVGDYVNVERAMVYNGRLDGHIIQGHVDATGVCHKVEELDGSWHFTFEYQPTEEHLLVNKGSVCINGVSLTVVDPIDNLFSVAIIPYTFENTVFKHIQVGSTINLEFDILGKYIAKYAKLYAKVLS
ncbi:MAG: riboflavin synthase [Saprospiraceae bacterium]|nr:riboflavin synthase [Saprospiraceae bacterium]